MNPKTQWPSDRAHERPVPAPVPTTRIAITLSEQVITVQSNLLVAASSTLNPRRTAAGQPTIFARGAKQVSDVC